MKPKSESRDNPEEIVPEQETNRSKQSTGKSVCPDKGGDPDDIILCIPGGKCYTWAELAALEKTEIPLFDMESDDHDAEN